MELPVDTYDWLRSLGAITEYDVKAKNADTVTLEAEATQQFELGLKMPAVIGQLCRLKKAKTPGFVGADKLDSLKDSITPTAKLFNWNAIKSALEVCGARLGEDEKGLIIAGDQQIIVELLKNLRELEARLKVSSAEQTKAKPSPAKSDKLRPKHPHKKRPGDVFSLNLSKDPNGTDTCLEFLLLTLSRSFDLQPKQTAALLTDGSKYLAHILIKGLRGDYQPVVRWLTTTLSSAQHFAQLLKDEAASSSMVFKALEGGLYSKDREVSLLSIKVLANLADSPDAATLRENLWQWLVAKDGGLEGIMHALKRSPDAEFAAVELLLATGQGRLDELFSHYVQELLPQPNDYWRFLAGCMQHIRKIKVEEKEYHKELQDLLSQWLEAACRQADNDGRHTVEERAVALNFLCEIWLAFPVVCESKAEVADYVLNSLMRGTRDKSQALQFYSLAMLFALLEDFAVQKRPFAPIVYKTLTFALVELYPHHAIRSFIEDNFVAVYRQLPSIPVSIVVDPLAKQIQTQEEARNEFNLCDFEFFFRLASHPRLGEKSAVLLLDILAQVALTDSLCAVLARPAILAVLNTKSAVPEVRDFLTKFVKLALSTIFTLQKTTVLAKKKKHDEELSLNPKPGKRYASYQAMKEELMREQDEETLRPFMARYIVDTLRDIQALDDPEQNEQMRTQVLATCARLRPLSRKAYDVLKLLLAKYGDPDQLFRDFLQTQQSADTKGAPLLAIEGGETEGPGSQKGTRKKTGMQLVPVSEIGQKAMVEIELIKKLRTEKELKKRTVQEEKLKVDERKRKAAKEQVERRNLELGVVSKNMKDVKDNLILSEGALEKQSGKTKKYNIELELVNLEEEEDRDREAVELYLSKYRKLFKYLFTKYANTSYMPKKQNFDALRHKFELMSLAEFRRLLSDHGVTTASLSREETITLFRLINVKLGRNDLATVTVEGFVEAFTQTAIRAFGKPPKNLSHLPLVEPIRELVTQFMQADEARGENTILYTDPDLASLQQTDQEVLRELTKKLEQSPNYPLPEGYRKVTEKEGRLDYSIQCLPSESGENMKLCCELLDELLSQELGVHILEPIVKYESRVLVRPVQSLRPSVLPPGSRRAETEAVSDDKEKEVIGGNKGRRLPLNINLVVAELPLGLRDVGFEVGAVVDDMIKAVTEGQSEIPDEDKGKDRNRALARKQLMDEECRRAEEGKEKKRKQRHQQLKQKIEGMKKTEEELAAKKKADEEEKKRRLEEKEKLTREQRKKDIADRILKLKEERSKKNEGKQKALIEEELKSKDEKERKLREREAFLKKKREEMDKMLHEKGEQLKKGREEEGQRAEVEKKRREKGRGLLEAKLKEDKEQREQIKQQKEELVKEDMVALAEKYGPHLRYLFEYYAKVDNVELDKASLMLWQHKTFIKFANQMKLVPSHVPVEDLNLIYKLVIRERQSQMQMLDYDGFVESLVRMAILARRKLVPPEPSAAEKEPEEKPQKETASALNMKGMSVAVVEALFCYMELEPGEKRSSFVQKLIDMQQEYSKGVTVKRSKGSFPPELSRPVAGAERSSVAPEEAAPEPENEEPAEKVEGGKQEAEENPSVEKEQEVVAPDGKTEKWDIQQ